MNVACDKCGKAYLLPDGALQPGVQVRIKCKQCANVFTVTQQLVVAAPPPEVKPEPLAEVPVSANVPSDPNAPPGEVTRAFIAQSGANRRNPPWKIALFVLGFVGLPTLALWLASSMGVATVKVTNEQGETVEQPFFSAQGVTGLRDLLSGAEAERRDKAAQAKAAAVARANAHHHGSGLGDDGPRGGTTGGAVGSGDLKGGNLAGFYADDVGKKDVGPKLRGGGDEAAPPTAHAGGLDDAAAAKVVAQSQPAFQSCIENALRRNPGLKVGKVIMHVSIGKSGAVKGTTIAPKVHEASDWGTCLAERAKRMVFPPFDGDDEAEIEVPLVVGVAF